MDLLAEAMVLDIYGGKSKGFMLDAYPMNLEQVEEVKNITFSVAEELQM